MLSSAISALKRPSSICCFFTNYQRIKLLSSACLRPRTSASPSLISSTHRQYSTINPTGRKLKAEEGTVRRSHQVHRPRPQPKSSNSNTESGKPSAEPRKKDKRWKTMLGKWYTPELRQKAIKEMLEERERNLRLATPTPVSLHWPSNDAEADILNIVAEQMDQLSPQEFANIILPYWDLQMTLDQALSEPSVPTLPPLEQLIINIPVPLEIRLEQAIKSLPQIAPTSPLIETNVSSEEIKSNNENEKSEISGTDGIIQQKRPNQFIEKFKNELKDNPNGSAPTIVNSFDPIDALLLMSLPIQLWHKFMELASKPATSDPSPINSHLSCTIADLATIVSTTSKSQQMIIKAMVEHDPEYAADALNYVLRDVGAKELSKVLVASLNPFETTCLLPMMCKVNPYWREDGLFDLMTDTLSTGGILRWDTADIARLIAELPKVPISHSYFSAPEFDPRNPENEDQTADQLLKRAQEMFDGKGRWDEYTWSPELGFARIPTPLQIESAKEYYEHEIHDTTETETTNSATIEEASDNKPELDPSAYLDVFSSTPRDEINTISQVVNVQNSLYYTPLAWQPEEIGRLCATLLSQELELNDITNLIINLATEHWKPESEQVQWDTFMGYLTNVMSEIALVNNHWVEEDLSWFVDGVLQNIGPWCLYQFPGYGKDQHKLVLSEIIAQIAIKYGHMKYDIRVIYILLNMLCDSWPAEEHEALVSFLEYRMKDRTQVGRFMHWWKWRVTGEHKTEFTEQQAALSKLWAAPYDFGDNPKLPTFVSRTEQEETNAERLHKLFQMTEDEKIFVPSRHFVKPQNEVLW